MFDSTIAPPLPPRPSQKRQRIWDEPPQEEQASVLGAPSDSWTPFDNVHGDPVHYPSLFPTADRAQTPPPTVPAFEVTDLFGAFGDASTRRTGLSIPEIVDEQPPTPTSMNSRKRSSDDAFGETIEAVAEQKVADPDAEVAAPETAVPTIEQVAPPPQRTIAQPKSIIRRALNAAKIMVPATALGAVFTVGALTALPESFFTVA